MSLSLPVRLGLPTLGLGSIRASIPNLTITLPAVTINLPNLLPGLLEGLLRAVPKKKTTHSKKRMRQLAGKGLKEDIALVRCPACGQVKRAHVFCPHCLDKIKSIFKKWDKAKVETEKRGEVYRYPGYPYEELEGAGLEVPDMMTEELREAARKASRQ
jgi:large subunit ribosomal protein L32